LDANIIQQAREQRGLSIDEVAEATKIPAGFLRAIEDDRLGDLPAGPYALGYIKSYSQFLGVHYEETPTQTKSLPKKRGRQRRTAVFAAAVATLALVGALAAGQSSREPVDPTTLPPRVRVKAAAVGPVTVVVSVDGGTPVEHKLDYGQLVDEEGRSEVSVWVSEMANLRVQVGGDAFGKISPLRPGGVLKGPRRLTFSDDEGTW